MRRFFFVLLSVLLLAPLVYFSAIKRTKGFCTKKILSHHSYNPKWDLGPLSQKEKELLARIGEEPFTLLGSGKECYAFVSEDGEIVVKFFKQNHMKEGYLRKYLPFPKTVRIRAQEMEQKHREKREALFQSYLIAYHTLKEETGVEYLHLTQTKGLNQTIRIKTKGGKTIKLNLDEMEFLVQKRATPIFDEIDRHPEKGEKIIASIIDLIKTRKSKGIGDFDINCERNLGLFGDQAMQIDIGEFYPIKPSPPTKEELFEATLDLRAFLENKHPELIPTLDEKIKSF